MPDRRPVFLTDAERMLIRTALDEKVARLVDAHRGDAGGPLAWRCGDLAQRLHDAVPQSWLTDEERARLVETLVYHWRTNTSGCGCGWHVLGASHPEHVVAVFEESVGHRAADVAPWVTVDDTGRVVRMEPVRATLADSEPGEEAPIFYRAVPVDEDQDGGHGTPDA